MRPRQVANLVTRELPDGETLVVTHDNTRAIVLNPVGSVVWLLCDGRRSTSEIAAFISDTLPDARPEQTQRDVEALLVQLGDAGLIEDANTCGDRPSG